MYILELLIGNIVNISLLLLTNLDLISLNNLSTINLQIGDVLLVPSNDEIEPYIYIVKSGDTLWSIARNNNITVDELKAANNLTNNLLSVGQQLLIP